MAAAPRNRSEASREASGSGVVEVSHFVKRDVAALNLVEVSSIDQLPLQRIDLKEFVY